MKSIFLSFFFVFFSNYCFSQNIFERTQESMPQCQPLLFHVQNGSVRIRGKIRDVLPSTAELSCDDTQLKVYYKGANKYVTEYFYMTLQRSDKGFAYLSSQTGLQAELPRFEESVCYRVLDERLDASVCLIPKKVGLR